jgi:hypothetical protein
MSDQIEINHACISDVVIVTFKHVNNTYALMSPASTSLSVFFGYMTSKVGIPKNSNITLDGVIAREIWTDLIKMGYERLLDFETKLNMKYKDADFSVFKVRNKDTKQYSSGGGGRFNWSRKGKTWNTLGHLKAHFNQLTRNKMTTPMEYQNSEIVEFGELRSFDVCDIDSINKIL